MLQEFLRCEVYQLWGTSKLDIQKQLSGQQLFVILDAAESDKLHASQMFQIKSYFTRMLLSLRCYVVCIYSTLSAVVSPHIVSVFTAKGINFPKGLVSTEKQKREMDICHSVITLAIMILHSSISQPISFLLFLPKSMQWTCQQLCTSQPYRYIIWLFVLYFQRAV